MDYLTFTRMRTQFLRFFYAEAARPFCDMQRKIETYEEPFDSPPGYEDGEPPFLSEWQEAGDALDVLGQSVASLAAQTLKLYVEHWVNELRSRVCDDQLLAIGVGVPSDTVYKRAFKRGWLAGFRAYTEKLGIDWEQCNADYSLLEQLILARNSAQHSSEIASLRARQTEIDARRYPSGFFADQFDVLWNDSIGANSRFVQPPRLDMSGERIARALDEVDALCSWLDGQHPLRRRAARDDEPSG